MSIITQRKKIALGLIFVFALALLSPILFDLNASAQVTTAQVNLPSYPHNPKAEDVVWKEYNPNNAVTSGSRLFNKTRTALGGGAVPTPTESLPAINLIASFAFAQPWISSYDGSVYYDHLLWFYSSHKGGAVDLTTTRFPETNSPYSTLVTRESVQFNPNKLGRNNPVNWGYGLGTTPGLGNQPFRYELGLPDDNNFFQIEWNSFCRNSPEVEIDYASYRETQLTVSTRLNHTSPYLWDRPATVAYVSYEKDGASHVEMVGDNTSVSIKLMAAKEVNVLLGDANGHSPKQCLRVSYHDLPRKAN